MYSAAPLLDFLCILIKRERMGWENSSVGKGLPLKREDLSWDSEFPQAQWHTLMMPVRWAEMGGRDSWISGAPWTVSLAERLSSRVCEIWSQGIKTAMFHTPENCHSRLSYRLPTCAHKYMCPVTSMLTKTCAQTHTWTYTHTFTSIKKGRRNEWSLRMRENIRGGKSLK